MAAPAHAQRMSLEEFLALPEEKPYLEFVNGEVQEKPMPTYKHGRLVMRLGVRLGSYLERTGEGEVVSEVRHATMTDADQWVFLPDVNVVPRAQLAAMPGEGPVRVHPVFAIEVLSPVDRPGRVNTRVDFYLRNGTLLLWVVDPESETITVYAPDAAPKLYRAGDTLGAQPVLSAFELNVGELFTAAAE